MDRWTCRLPTLDLHCNFQCLLVGIHSGHRLRKQAHSPEERAQSTVGMVLVERTSYPNPKVLKTTTSLPWDPLAFPCPWTCHSSFPPATGTSMNMLQFHLAPCKALACLHRACSRSICLCPFSFPSFQCLNNSL